VFEAFCPPQDTDAPASAAHKEDLEKRALLKEAKKNYDKIDASKEALAVTVGPPGLPPLASQHHASDLSAAGPISPRS
jgi:hypothetical protein